MQIECSNLHFTALNQQLKQIMDRDIILNGGFSSSEFKSICIGSISSSGMAYHIIQKGYLQNDGFFAGFYSLEFSKNLKDWYSEYNVFMNLENPIYEMFV